MSKKLRVLLLALSASIMVGSESFKAGIRNLAMFFSQIGPRLNWYNSGNSIIIAYKSIIRYFYLSYSDEQVYSFVVSNYLLNTLHTGNNRAIVAKLNGLTSIVQVMDSCAGSATVQIAAFHALRNIVCRNCEYYVCLWVPSRSFHRKESSEFVGK